MLEESLLKSINGYLLFD